VTSPLTLFRRQSLRVRITLSFVVTAALLTLTLSTATFLSVRTVLENNRVSSSTRQTIFALLFAREFLSTNPEQAQRLVSLLQSREPFDAMVTSGDAWFSTTISLTPALVPAGLQALVAGERLGYQFTHIGGERMVVFGTPLPPARTNLYVFYSVHDIDRTLALLARALAISGLAVVLVAAALAQRVSRRILRPLVGVSAAARQVAEGLLETRVDTATRDEVGTLAASFNQMANALQEMIQRERRFVAAVSHELRTPLAALHATSEVLAARRAELPPASREAVEMVAEDVNDLRHLVEELLEVSELDLQRAAVRWERIDLRALVAAVIAKRRKQVVPTGPAIVTYSDKARLERILGNLIDNAFDHGEGRDVRVTLGLNGVNCEVTVSDRGPGISSDDVPRLFERFYKADRSRTRGRGGIGLGLAIAGQNASLLGGTIQVRSSTGDGASFVVRLPLRTEPPGQGT
jgi:two-component system sensor histidine kinase MtrB